MPGKYFYCFVVWVFFISCNHENDDSYHSIEGVVTSNEDHLTENRKGRSKDSDTLNVLLDSRGKPLKTGEPIASEGRVLDPNTLSRPKVTSVKKIKPLDGYSNSYRISEGNLLVKKLAQKLKDVPHSVVDSGFLLINSFGDTVPTGKKIFARGVKVPSHQPHPTIAKNMGVRDNAIYDIQYLSLDQGLPSSYLHSTIEDRYGNLWFATERGVTKYDGVWMTNYTEKEGLISNQIISTMEDGNGNLWFGTWGYGLSVYDGHSFTQYTEESGLSNNFILTIFEDSKGNIWLGTRGGGVTKYDGEYFTHYTTREGISNNVIRSIVEDKKGDLWFGTWGGGVSQYDGEIFRNYRKKEGLSNNLVFSIDVDKDDNLWIATQRGGLNKFDKSSFTHYTKKSGLSDNYVRTVKVDGEGSIWLGTSGHGVSKIDKDIITHISKEQGLNGIDVQSIFEDKSGNLWFATRDGGVCKYNVGSFNHFSWDEDTFNNDVTALLNDSKGNTWIGSWRTGVLMYDGTQCFPFDKKEGLNLESVFSAMEDSKGNIWLGTLGAGVSMYNGQNITSFTESEGLSNISVFSILEDQKGNIWFGTYGSGLSKYDGTTFTHFSDEDGLSSNLIYCMIEGKQGNMWLGTNKGITKYDGKSFTRYTETEGFTNKSVHSILEDIDGNIWFGIYEQGLIKYDGSRFMKDPIQNGITGNTVYTLIEDSDYDIWAGTEKGLNLLVFSDTKKTRSETGISIEKKTQERVTTPKVVSFGRQDGLKGIEFNQNAVCKDGDNRVWWGSNKCLEMLDLNHFSLNTNIPSIQLKSIDVNGSFVDFRWLNDSLKQEVVFDSMVDFFNYPINLELSFNKNHLTFNYSGIDWKAPHRVQYSFRMSSLNVQWSSVSNETKAEYRNLPYGDHTFQVRAIGQSGVWSEPFEYKFTILPPWWHTWWARTGYGILILVVSLVAGFWWTKRLRKKYELERELIELEQKALKSQMNTHFIFNAIDLSRVLISDQKLDAAQKHLSEVAKLIRLTLENSDEALVSIEDELECLRSYLEVCTMLYPNKFTYNIELDPNIDTEALGIPPLLIQPFIENALIHGVLKSDDHGKINIRLAKKNESIDFLIKNTVPRNQNDSRSSSFKKKSMGLQITKQRIKNINYRKGVDDEVNTVMFDDSVTVSFSLYTEYLF